ncbi:glycosyltransferase [Thermosyntropha sp.]|uniref:CgeB family protein n=1 Tax=Thermosyntropha sp. TaxID=2740820 RepID=UPI0025D832AE|nr:glycosyltransferase [Thermosyntropha sp.]MBO8158633.1 glycosyltransferase [Thermosyntropha sp.]
MKIIFVNNPPYITYGIAAGLKQIGEEVDIIPLWMISWDKQEEVLKKRLEETKPDYIFTDGDPPNLNWKAVYDSSRFFGIPLIYWATEDPLWFKEISILRSLPAEYVWTTAEELIPEYVKRGKKSELLLFSCNPDFHKKTLPNSDYICDIMFVGSNYEHREKIARSMLLPLMERGYDIKVWGHWWLNQDKSFTINPKFYGGFIPYEKLPEAYSSAKIVLGMHLDDTSFTQTSMRTYEVLGCGAFYLTWYTKAHEHLFKKGIHLDWVKNSDEVIEKVEYYLHNEDIRNKIACEGQAYVYAHHTAAQRAYQLCSFLSK